MATMKACLMPHPGSPENLEIGRVEIPKPGSRDVRVRIIACGLNPVDWKLMRTGLPNWTWPHIPGLDIAGVIDAVGEKILGFKPGESVMSHLNLERQGGLAEYALADPDTLSRLPEEIDFVTAASLPCAALTAWLSLTRKIQLRKGETLLVQAGSGGVGGFAIQMARHLGATVFATGSTDNIQYIESLGAKAIDYKLEPTSRRVMEMTGGRGVDAVLEVFSGQQATDDLKLLAFGGRMACLQGLPPLDSLEPFTISPSLHEISLGGSYLSGDERARRDFAVMGNEILDLLIDHRIHPLPIHELGLHQVADVLTKYSNGNPGKPGKRVVILDDRYSSIENLGVSSIT